VACYLVTGGAGFIGSHLVHRFVAEGHDVRVIDNFSTGKRKNLAELAGRIELIEGDLRQPADCARAARGVEVVFHQAAVPSVPKSVQDPQTSHDANVNGTFNLLMAARQAKVRRVVYASSSSAYGDTPELPKHEQMPPAPMSPYAVQKLAGEYYCRAFAECFGLQTLSLRYFNVFGPRQDPASQYAAAIPAFVTAILGDRPPTVFGDGEQSRDFTHVDNVVEANVLAAKAPNACGQAVNVACGERVTVNQIIELINKLLGKDVRPTYAASRAGDVRHSLADITLARQLLGFEPAILFGEGLRRTIDWYRTSI
jgi:nucleoside-diphosphate-sugar epimerase